MKVAIYAICKNEIKNVERFINTCSEADLVVVTDTGSTDGTQEALRKRGIEVHQREIKPWRFDHAYNEAIANLPEDVDICVSLDFDETISLFLRKRLEDLWDEGTHLMCIPYVNSWKDNEHTIPQTIFYRDRIHARHNVQWKYPIYCILEAKVQISKNIYTDEIAIYHHQEEGKEKRYLELFNIALDENPNNYDMVFGRGEEFMSLKRYEEAINDFKKFLKITPQYTNKHDSIAQRRSVALRYIATCLNRIKTNPEQILPWLLSAVAESPYNREVWVYLAQCWKFLGDAPQAYAAMKNALKITNMNASLFNEGFCWDLFPEEFAEDALKQIFKLKNNCII
jgi:glycosyltransferase involved in cell wall biosynthesis